MRDCLVEQSFRFKIYENIPFRENSFFRHTLYTTSVFFHFRLRTRILLLVRGRKVLSFQVSSKLARVSQKLNVNYNLVSIIIDNSRIPINDVLIIL